jgi:F-type H+-transporting ATPase subunit epsilon
MQFDLVSPERRLASMQARSVQIPGADGDMTAMPDHAPVITTLRPGVLSVEGTDGTQEFVVTGGFAEITGEGATVLAESALPKGDVDAEFLQPLLDAARERADKASSETIDAAQKAVADLLFVGESLGVNLRPA